MPTKNRVTITIHLNPQKDADLVRWLDELQPKTRAQQALQALRRGLNMKERTPLKEVVEHDAILGQRLEQLEAEYRAKMAWVDQWIEYLNNGITQISSPYPVQQTSNLEPVERIADEEREKRTKNLMKAKW